MKVHLTPAMLQHYREVNRENARRFAWEADYAVINDPQPVFLIEDMRPQARYWIWRCHIDASRPDRQVWRFLRTRCVNTTPPSSPCPIFRSTCRTRNISSIPPSTR